MCIAVTFNVFFCVWANLDEIHETNNNGIKFNSNLFFIVFDSLWTKCKNRNFQNKLFNVNFAKFLKRVIGNSCDD